MLKATGLDKAILGITDNREGEQIIAYDRGRCLKIFMERDGMSYEDADEFFAFNVEGAYLGKGTPIFVDVVRRPEANRLEERLREIVDAAKEALGQADNQEPTHPSTIERLTYAVEESEILLGEPVSHPGIDPE